jgi:sugar transferase (PEP-CTERM/EpsH1 system associated)
VHDQDEASRAGELDGLAASVRTATVPRIQNQLRSLVGLAGNRPTTHTMLDSPDMPAAIASAVAEHPPDVVLAYCSGMARWALEAPLDRVPLVLDLVDVDSAKWRDLAGVSWPPIKWIYAREARVLGAFEARAARQASRTLVVTPREREELVSLAPDTRVDVVPNGVDTETLRPANGPSDSSDVVFCGVMNYPPNEHAALLLGRSVWPLVRQRRPDATLTLVGALPTPRVQALESVELGITVTGAVPDVRPYLWRAAVAAAPLLTARGIQNKVLEAVAAGLPVVVTPNLVPTLPDAVKPAVSCASTPEALADAICRLLALSPHERRSLANQADVAELAWDRQLQPLESILDEAARMGHRPLASAG